MKQPKRVPLTIKTEIKVGKYVTFSSTTLYLIIKNGKITIDK